MSTLLDESLQTTTTPAQQLRTTMTEPNAPAFCRDERRAYVWAVLSAESAIGPADNAVRVLSPADGTAPTIPSPTEGFKKYSSTPGIGCFTASPCVKHNDGWFYC